MHCFRRGAGAPFASSPVGEWSQQLTRRLQGPGDTKMVVMFQSSCCVAMNCIRGRKSLVPK